METEKEMTAIQKTQVYLENYREIERYIKDAISEVSQIDDVSRYNISAEKAFLQSIRRRKPARCSFESGNQCKRGIDRI